MSSKFVEIINNLYRDYPPLEHFKYSEFHSISDPYFMEKTMDFTFLIKLDELRKRWNKPIIINSGFRSSKYNNSISKTGLSGPHTTGRAVDIRICNPEAAEFLELVYELKFFNGVGINQKGNISQRFIHLDNLERKAIWSY